jgi:uncharacterized membrane protein
MTGDILLALHLLGAVLWVGGMFFAVVVLRPSLSVLGGPQRIALHRQVFRRFFLVIWHAMPIVLLTGYAMVGFVYGGFGGVGWNVHVMHLLGLVMTVIFLMIFFGPYAQVRRAGDDAAPASIERIRKLVMVNLALGLVTVVVAALM